MVLLGLDQGEFDPDRSMGELAALCEANHMQAVAELVQKRAAPEAGTVWARGKLAEARSTAKTSGRSRRVRRRIVRQPAAQHLRRFGR